MTVDEVVEVIAFIVGGLVLAWGFRSLAFAVSGGERSGMHELGAPSEASSADSDSDEPPEPAEAEAAEATRAARTHRMHQVANYALSLAAMGALVAMLVGAALA